ncbi:MAG: rRNA maturation RNase YbeY [Pseudomonadota bacterium]
MIDIVVKSKKWAEIKNVENFVEKTIQKIIPLTDLKKILKEKFILEISVSLVSDLQMKKINAEFRGKNKATNVLSFPALDENLIRQIGLKKLVGADEYLFLGDIIIAFETLKKESLAQKKKFHDHLTHLILHSILHLIGYDHEEEKMAKIMEDLEVKILKKLKIKDPYQLNF